MALSGNELALSLVVGALFAGGIYAMLRRNLLRFAFGLLLFSNGVNLLIFTAGTPRQTAPPVIPYGADAPVEAVANALPQALILTAIVIGFGLVAFTLVLLLRGYETLGSVQSDELPVRLARLADAVAVDAVDDAATAEVAAPGEPAADGVAARREAIR